jgi:hypothetical protein
METWYKYTFTINGGQHPEIAYSFKLKIKLGENILEKGYLAIQNATSFNRFKKVNNINNLMDINNLVNATVSHLLESLPEDVYDITPVFIKEDKLETTTNNSRGSGSNSTNNTNKLKKNIVNPLESINKTKFSINNVQELIGCSGCYNESLSQMSHMECPEGCLHEKKECVNCTNSTEKCSNNNNDSNNKTFTHSQNKESEPISRKRKRGEDNNIILSRI